MEHLLKPNKQQHETTKKLEKLISRVFSWRQPATKTKMPKKPAERAEPSDEERAEDTDEEQEENSRLSRHRPSTRKQKTVDSKTRDREDSPRSSSRRQDTSPPASKARSRTGKVQPSAHEDAVDETGKEDKER
jgi:hypothetical protein